MYNQSTTMKQNYLNQQADDREEHIEDCLHSTLGFLNDPSAQIKSFNENDLLPYLQLSSGQQLINKIKDFPSLNIKNYHQNHVQMLILHSRLTIILNKIIAYERSKGKTDDQIVLPSTFCHQLYEVSKALGIKPSMTIAYMGNWYPLSNKYIEKPEQFSFEDFDLCWFLTNNPKQQKYFFGNSLIASLHLARVNKILQYIQDSIISQVYDIEDFKIKFKLCINPMNKIIEATKILYDSFSPQFFYFTLRPLVTGYKNLKFSGVFDNEGNEMILTHPGGTGGYDPSFQMFQSAMGITFKQDYKSTQDALYKEGMIINHRKVIDRWRGWQKQKKLNIRNFCNQHSELKQQYNNILKKYKQFLNLHSIILSRFILANIPQHQQSSAIGTGNTLITKIMKRHEVIEQHYLKL